MKHEVFLALLGAPGHIVRHVEVRAAPLRILSSPQPVPQATKVALTADARRRAPQGEGFIVPQGTAGSFLHPAEVGLSPARVAFPAGRPCSAYS